LEFKGLYGSFSLPLFNFQGSAFVIFRCSRLECLSIISQRFEFVKPFLKLFSRFFILSFGPLLRNFYILSYIRSLVKELSEKNYKILLKNRSSLCGFYIIACHFISVNTFLKVFMQKYR